MPDDTSRSKSPYVIARLPEGRRPVDFDDPLWQAAAEMRIGSFHSRSSPHRPTTRVRLLYDEQALHVLYRVEDRYVLCRQQGWQAAVCRDSCVEAFLRPRLTAPPPHNGYLNFETNCGGSMLLLYIEDARRRPGGFEKFTPVPEALGRQIEIHHSMPARVDPERTEPTSWQLQLAIPFKVFEQYVGPLGPLPGQVWQANFLKCADDCSHPHWGSWASIGELLNFHQPEKFAAIQFESSKFAS